MIYSTKQGNQYHEVTGVSSGPNGGTLMLLESL